MNQTLEATQSPEATLLPPTRALSPSQTPAGPAGLSPSNPSPASRFANYELLKKIGSGGMGTVMLARHRWLGRQVAIKFISPDAIDNPEAVERFMHEARAMGTLDHPHVVRATDAGCSDEKYFIVTEFIAGQDLSRLVKQWHALHVADACEIIRQAALGLQHVHERGLVHRDVKPANLILDAAGTVKLLDFGLARMAAGQTTLTSTGQMLGTLDFLAPEQASDARHVDIRSDIYSLGCTLQFLLTGQPPFAGPEYETPVSKIQGHLANEPAPLVGCRGKVPFTLSACLARMMAKSPDERYRTPAEVADALLPFCRGANLAALAESDLCYGLATPIRRAAAPGGLGSLVQGAAAFLGWGLRDLFRRQPAAGRGTQREPWVSVTGLVILFLMGFFLMQFSCVPIDDAALGPDDDGIQFFQFGWNDPPPPRAKQILISNDRSP